MGRYSGQPASAAAADAISWLTVEAVMKVLKNPTSGEPTLPRAISTTNSLSMTSGTMLLTWFYATKTETVTKVRWGTGGTAASGLTLTRFGIYTFAGGDPTADLTLAASTAADSTATWGSSTEFDRNLQASWNKVRGTWYAFGSLFVGTTPPSVLGNTLASGPLTDEAPRTAAQVASLSDIPSSITAASLSGTNNRQQSVLLLP